MENRDIEAAVQKIVQELEMKSAMNLKLATALIGQVEKKAEEMGVKAVVAVSDASGRPVAVHCMDGAYIGSYDVGLNKTGGEPLYLGDVMIGAIGVSGGTAEQDTLLGRYAKNKLKDVIAWK